MARFDLRGIQDKTNNGNLAKDLDIRNKKMLARLEYELQNSKTKLSVARNENSHIKKKIHDLRLEKCLNLQILNDLVSVLFHLYDHKLMSLCFRVKNRKK